VIETYFSHSWRSEDVDLNVLVWEQICGKCCLSVDREGNQRREGGFFVNRLEYLIGQSQAFVAVLSYRADSGSQNATARDADLKCSKPTLFEIRLAERARKPRLIICDQRTRFRLPHSTASSELALYVPINSSRELNNGGAQIRPSAESWLSKLEQYHSAGHIQPRTDAMILVNKENERSPLILAEIKEGLQDSRFATIHEVEPWHLDSEIIQMLQTTDLLIAEVGSIDSSVLGVAHALFIPTIRFTVAPEPQVKLPSVLTGHPFGYERDVFFVDKIENLSGAIRDRIAAMDSERYLIKDRAEGLAYFRKQLTKPNRVFISHNLPESDRSLTERLVAKLKENNINTWEYRDEMKTSSGAVWEERLDAAMKATTHVVFIAGQNFEAKPQCAKELNYFANERRLREGAVFPFLRSNRTLPIPQFSNLNNPRLPDDPDAAATMIADKVIQAMKKP
jgi:hypothetical protein